MIFAALHLIAAARATFNGTAAIISAYRSISMNCFIFKMIAMNTLVNMVTGSMVDAAKLSVLMMLSS